MNSDEIMHNSNYNYSNCLEQCYSCLVLQFIITILYLFITSYALKIVDLLISQLHLISNGILMITNNSVGNCNISSNHALFRIIIIICIFENRIMFEFIIKQKHVIKLTVLYQ